MSGWIRRFLFVVLGLLVILGVGLAIYLPRAARASFPQTDGEIQLPGLDGRVDIYRDTSGIPHIYASTEHDLFFAQGFVQAQDRFWQMDFQRHVSAGRLSELMGSTTVDTDLFLRTLGWERVAKQELESLNPQTRAMLDAFSEGVNAYLDGRSGTDLSYEYLFLNLVNRGYQPEPWTPLNSLTWAKAMAWDLRQNMDSEIARSILLNSLSADQIADLYPDYDYANHPVIVSDFEVSDQSAAVPVLDASVQRAILPVLQQSAAHMAAADTLLGGWSQAELGSNSWVISGERTASGLPLLANDPHLDQAMPSIWYQVGLHCAPVTADCSYAAVGVSFASAPGIVIGHNDRIAWGFTNTEQDVSDLYIIKVNPDNPDQYEMNGEWVDMQVVEETVEVGGGDPIVLPVRITQFGPIISDSYGDLETLDETSGLDLPENYAIALRWTALEPGSTFEGVLEFARAQNWDEFRQAARKMVVPAQNLVYADVDGNIGYQMPGNVPIRAAGDGRYPVPGWTDEYAWTGYIPFEDLPNVYNPPADYIATANNAIVGADYPYRLADVWAYGYRAQRIVDMLTQAGQGIDMAAVEKMQTDSMNLGAEETLPYLMAVDLGDAHLDEVRGILAGWDFQQTVDSGPAALYNAFWKHLLAVTFHDELPEDYWPTGGGRWFTVVKDLLPDVNNAWWDDVSTPVVENRDDMLRAAFADAVSELEDTLGKDPATWRWGDLHTITFAHQVMSDFPLGIAKLFNRGPYEVPGGSSIVNAIGGDASRPDYTVDHIPSKRTIMDLSDWEASMQINATGNSGHAYDVHNDDMAPLWAAGEYLPMHWDRTAIEADAESHLVLMP